jgi:hypothetical protein
VAVRQVHSCDEDHFWARYARRPWNGVALQVDCKLNGVLFSIPTQPDKSSMATLLMPLPDSDFDPTESGVPWRTMRDHGHNVVFATPAGRTARADPKMVTGEGLGILSPLLKADANGRSAYLDMEQNDAFRRPISYGEIRAVNFDGLLLAGGHRYAGLSRLRRSAIGCCGFLRTGETCWRNLSWRPLGRAIVAPSRQVSSVRQEDHRSHQADGTHRLEANPFLSRRLLSDLSNNGRGRGSLDVSGA